MNGLVFDIQKFSIHDGPGIRTTVFLKGCPLDCFWCHNPESRSVQPEISFIGDKCIGCHYCSSVCPTSSHVFTAEGHQYNRDSCKVCGLCTLECYAHALELVGKPMTVEEVLAEVRKDIPFYKNSGGGMTLSGGEPTLQIEFITPLLKAAHEEGIHCCIETSGYCGYDRIEKIRPYVNLWLYDWKETNPQRHRDYCRVENNRILENLYRLYADGGRIRLRCPIIPGYNDRPEHFEGIARIANDLPLLEGIELMPYHNLGESKHLRFATAVPASKPVETPSKEQIQSWIYTLHELGVPVLNATH